MTTSCNIKGLQEFFDQFKKSVELMDKGMEQVFIPATDAQLKLLKRIAKKTRKAFKKICSDYGADVNHLSKEDARIIIGKELYAINKKSK